MDDIALDWHDSGPRNARTGDVYFSPRDGLAESRYVFLEGCRLPEGWALNDVCTIGEIGFGTGLNFLAASALFLEHKKPGQHLVYVGFEKFPLAREQAMQATARWKDELPLYDTLYKHWPLRIPGFHWVPLHKDITLLLVHGDAAEGLQQLVAPRGIDAWFLDGFSPAKDESAWTQSLYDGMAMHSHDQTRLASFTAVSRVRHGLTAAGFTVKRIHGYGYKWHMTVAGFQGRPKPEAPARPRHVTIKGAGLSGSACAHALSRFDIPCSLNDPDRDLKYAASGNPLGAVKPRLTNKPSVRSAWYAAGYALAQHVIPEQLKHRVPALQFKTDIDVASYGWHPDHLFTTDDRDAIAGVTVPDSGICFADALLVSPKDLSVHWRGDTPFEPQDGDVIIHATGHAYSGMRPVRGQLTFVKEAAPLKAMLFYGGYATPAIGGVHTIGATFGRGEDATDLRAEDDADNLARLAPYIKEDWQIVGSRASVRANTPDRLPLVGRLNDREYVSAGHGSHGITAAPLAAAVIVGQMLGLPAPLPRDVLAAIAGDRFASPA